jgi:hypothetical protein
MQKALAVLNPEQLARWHAMTGPPFAGLSDWQHHAIKTDRAN